MSLSGTGNVEGLRGEILRLVSGLLNLRSPLGYPERCWVGNSIHEAGAQEKGRVWK